MSHSSFDDPKNGIIDEDKDEEDYILFSEDKSLKDPKQLYQRPKSNVFGNKSTMEPNQNDLFL